MNIRQFDSIIIESLESRNAPVSQLAGVAEWLLPNPDINGWDTQPHEPKHRILKSPSILVNPTIRRLASQIGRQELCSEGPSAGQSGTPRLLEQAMRDAGVEVAKRLATLAGREAYAIPKQAIEPVSGIIKSVRWFRQFSLPGLRKVNGERNLVCLAWKVKRMAVIRPKIE